MCMWACVHIYYLSPQTYMGRVRERMKQGMEDLAFQEGDSATLQRVVSKDFTRKVTFEHESEPCGDL